MTDGFVSSTRELPRHAFHVTGGVHGVELLLRRD